jgi:hypothetical protein
MVWVAIGTTLELGASSAKNHPPQNPTGGHRRNAKTVRPPSVATTMASTIINPISRIMIVP